MKKTKVYLAYPYRHKDPEVMRQRSLGANNLAGRIIRWGEYIVFSPLSHSVPIADTLGNHCDEVVWMEQDLAWLACCDELWIAMVPGWCDSFGIAKERFEAIVLGLKIKFVVPWGEDGYRICTTQEVFASMEASRPVRALEEEDGGLSDLYP